MAALVVQADAQLLLVDYLAALLPSIPEAAGYTVGTRVADNVTPVHAIRVRLVGGTGEQRVSARPRCDVRVWADGSATTEFAALKLARIMLGYLERDLKVRIFAGPVPLPDPADPAKTLVLFTVELLLRGVQP